MSKARKKSYKQGTAKRLAQESLILSCTRFLSSRFIRLFESGFASPLITSADTVDGFARKRITAPLSKRLGLKKNFSMPARNAVASFFANNRVFGLLASFRRAFLNSSIRSIGVFLLTFGIYAASIFLLKSYVSLELGADASIDDVCVAAITALAGLLFTFFGEKSILAAVGKSRIVGGLISKSLGVNESSLDRNISASSGTAVGFGFLLGSLFGISTLFFSPIKVLLFLLAVTLAFTVMNIPEFGLLLTVLVFSFVPIRLTSIIVLITLASFLLKCIRLKRNFRFGTADAVVLLMLVLMYFTSLVFEGISVGESYILIFTAIYFLAKNLLCSERLVVQTFNALCSGITLGIVLYILGDFAALIPHLHLREAALWLSSSVLDADMLALLTVCIMPFALSSFSGSLGKRTRSRFLFFALIGAFVIDSKLFYILLAVSVLVYVAVAHKALFGALLGSLIIIPPLLVLASDYSLSSAVAIGRSGYDISLALNSETVFQNLWTGLYEISNGATVALFALALTLIIQRVFASLLGERVKQTSVFGGPVAASAVMLIVCTSIFNPFSDLRSLIAMWFIFGLCGAVYKLGARERNGYTEV